MKNKKSILAITLLVIVILACSTSNSIPSNTSIPANTLTPTVTPTPLIIEGVHVPMRYIDVSFLVNHVDLASTWVDKGTAYLPLEVGDMFLVVYLDVTDGDVYLLPFPPADIDVMSDFRVSDNKGNVDKLTFAEVGEEAYQKGQTLLLLFQVDSAARNFVFAFPNGQEIDLSSFLN